MINNFFDCNQQNNESLKQKLLIILMKNRKSKLISILLMIISLILLPNFHAYKCLSFFNTGNMNDLKKKK